MATALREDEMTILARYLGNGNYELPPDIARYIVGFIDGDDVLPADIARYLLTIQVGDKDQARLHDLLQRHRADRLSDAEKEEALAMVNAGTSISILKSKARRVLKVPPPKSRYRKKKS